MQQTKSAHPNLDIGVTYSCASIPESATKITPTGSTAAASRTRRAPPLLTLRRVCVTLLHMPICTWNRSEKYTDRFQRRRKPETAGAALKAASCRRVRMCACSPQITRVVSAAWNMNLRHDWARQPATGLRVRPFANWPSSRAARCVPVQGAPGTGGLLCS